MEINVGEETLYYRRQGEGKVFLLLHGNMSSGLFFQRTMKEIDGFDFIAPDMRGFGNSSYRKKSAELRDYVEDMKQFILTLDLQHFHICGWSFGGGVLLSLLQDREVSSRIDQTVFLSSMSCKGLVTNGKSQEYFDLFRPLTEISQGKKIWEHSFFSNDVFSHIPSGAKVHRNWEHYLPEKLRKAFIEKVFLQYVYSEQRPPEKEFCNNIQEAVKQRNFLEINRVISTFQIDPSTLPKKDYIVLHGAKDRTIDISVGRALARELKGKFYCYPQCGHSIFTDDFLGWKHFLCNLKH